MKKAIYITITALVLASCGSGSGNSVESVIASKDVEAIRAKRNSVTEELKALESQVKQLDEAIGELEDNTKLPLVSALTVEPQQFQHYLELQGDVMTDQNVLVYPEMAGNPLPCLC